MTAGDGMKVHTRSENAAEGQEAVLEFILLNHPLDCPVCDKGGECPLQDLTYRYGPGNTRFHLNKRTYEKPLADLAADRARPRALHPLLPLHPLLAGRRRGRAAGRARARRDLRDRDVRGAAVPRSFLGQRDRAVPGRRADLDASTASRRGPGRSTTSRRVCGTVPDRLQHLGAPCARAASGACSRATIPRSTRAGCATRGRFAHGHLRAGDRYLHGPGARPARARARDAPSSSPRRSRGACATTRRLHGPESIAVVASGEQTNEEAYAWAELVRAAGGGALVSSGLRAAARLGRARALRGAHRRSRPRRPDRRRPASARSATRPACSSCACARPCAAARACCSRAAAAATSTTSPTGRIAARRRSSRGAARRRAPGADRDRARRAVATAAATSHTPPACADGPGGVLAVPEGPERARPPRPRLPRRRRRRCCAAPRTGRCRCSSCSATPIRSRASPSPSAGRRRCSAASPSSRARSSRRRRRSGRTSSCPRPPRSRRTARSRTSRAAPSACGPSLPPPDGVAPELAVLAAAGRHLELELDGEPVARVRAAWPRAAPLFAGLTWETIGLHGPARRATAPRAGTAPAPRSGRAAALPERRRPARRRPPPAVLRRRGRAHASGSRSSAATRSCSPARTRVRLGIAEGAARRRCATRAARRPGPRGSRARSRAGRRALRLGRRARSTAPAAIEADAPDARRRARHA